MVAKETTSLAMASSPFICALNTIGVMSPAGVLTATLISTTWFLFQKKKEISIIITIFIRAYASG